MANSITITGALGRAPSLNSTGQGTPAWGFPLGFTPQRKTDNGWEDAGPTLWFDVTSWGDDAADLAQRYAGVERGRATVTGRVGSKTWTNRDGIEQTQMTITAEAVQIHPPKGQQSYQPQGATWTQGETVMSTHREQQREAQQPAQQSQGGPRQQADPWSQPQQQGGWGGGGGGSLPANSRGDEPPFEA